MKKNNVKSVGILVIFSVLTLNTFSQSDAEIKTKIEKINKEMAQAMVAGNSEKILSYYASDAISLPSYEKIADGIEAIKKSNMEMMSSGMKFNSFEATILKVNTCDKMIIEIGTYKISFTMAGMEAPMNDNGKYITIWEKQKDGSLKIKVETWNTDNNPWEHMGDMEHKEHKEKM